MTSNLINLGDVQRREVVWLKHGWIPRGMLSMLAGDPGLGKSLWTMNLAAERTRLGEHVVLCCVEDSLEYGIKPRLQAAGAVTSLVHSFSPKTRDGHDRDASFPSDGTLLLQIVQEVGASLVVLDPLAALLDSDVDSHKDA